MPKFRGWERMRIGGATGVEAVAPVIVSASRATDIPAFYPEWLVRGLKRGYIRWTNPFSGRQVYVSFEKARAFIFWSKNPAPLIPYLPVFDRMGFCYYFQFTLNDYEKEGLEPNLPSLKERINTFERLSKIVGADRVIWRFDPLVLSDTLTVDELARRVGRIADEIHSYTRRLVISFVEIDRYRKVRRRMEGLHEAFREFTLNEKQGLAGKLQEMNKIWGLGIETCAEEADLKRFGIGRGHCIDPGLLHRLFPDDFELARFLGSGGQTDLSGKFQTDANVLKDPGQRAFCRCTVSKDIGQYNTCMHLCTYCYANVSEAGVRRNYAKYRAQRDMGRFPDAIVPIEMEKETSLDLSYLTTNLMWD